MPMNSTDTITFNQAVTLAQTGAKTEAHAYLYELWITNPTDINLLLWLAFTANDNSSAARYIEQAASIEPNNATIASARTWLSQQSPAAIQPSPDRSTYYANQSQPQAGYYNNTQQAQYIPETPPSETFRFQATAPTAQPEPIPSNYAANVYSSLQKPAPAKLNFSRTAILILGVGLVAFAVLILMLLVQGSDSNSSNQALANVTPTVKITEPQLFVSKTGGFSIMMPGIPQLKTRTDNSSGYTYNIYEYDLATDDYLYQAGYMDVDPRIASVLASQPRTYLDGILNGLMQNGKTQIFNETNIRLGGLEGIEFSFRDNSGGMTGKGRIYYLSSRLFLESFSSLNNTTPPYDAQQFLDSFRYGVKP
jgi:hypothetical protein